MCYKKWRATTSDCTRDRFISHKLWRFRLARYKAIILQLLPLLLLLENIRKRTREADGSRGRETLKSTVCGVSILYISLVSLSHENGYLKEKERKGRKQGRRERERKKKPRSKPMGGGMSQKTRQWKNNTRLLPPLSRQYISFFHSDP